MKSDFSRIMTWARTLLKRVITEDGWRCATFDNTTLDGMVSAAEDTVKGIGSEWIAMDAKEIKRKYKDRHQMLQQGLKNLMANLDGQLKSIENHPKVMLAMRTAMDNING